MEEMSYENDCPKKQHTGAEGVMYVQNCVLNVYGASNSIQGVKPLQQNLEAYESGRNSPNYDAPFQHVIPFLEQIAHLIRLFQQHTPTFNYHFGLCGVLAYWGPSDLYTIHHSYYLSHVAYWEPSDLYVIHWSFILFVLHVCGILRFSALVYDKYCDSDSN